MLVKKQWFLLFLFQSIVIFGQEQIDLVVTTHLGAGFFCEFNKVLGAINHFQDQDLRSISVDWTDRFFPYKKDPNENGWLNFFESMPLSSSQGNNFGRLIKTHMPHNEVHNQHCLAPWTAYEAFFPFRLYMHDQLNRYIKIKQSILDEVESFYHEHLYGSLIISVQVRHALVHEREIPGGRRPGLQDYQREIDALIRKHKNDSIKIFLASDSQKVIEHFKRIYGKRLISINAFRAPNEQDPHLIYEKVNYYTTHEAQWHRDKPGYWGGLTALMDALLLAKGDYFIHTMSNMAHTVTFFNPYIQSIYLPKSNYAPCRCRPQGQVAKNPYFNPLA